MELVPFDHCSTLAIGAEVRRSSPGIAFSYGLSGDIADVVIPAGSRGERTDGLWQATCFEAFIAVGRTSYVELNFAPSGAWAAYRFTDYRKGMKAFDIAPPEILFTENRLVATVMLEAAAGAAFNLAAVIEHRSGARSYWALAHPKSNRPDFHARDCFVARLP